MSERFNGLGAPKEPPEELSAAECVLWTMVPRTNVESAFNCLLTTIAQERKMREEWSHHFDTLMYALVCLPSEGVEAGVAKAHKIQRKADALREAMGSDQPWPVADVLDKLTEAADILLHEKDYDGHGYELIVHAVDAAKSRAADIRKALAP